MLREEVLKSWGSCKGKITRLSKDIEFLDEQTAFNVLPTFPLDFDTARRSLDFWTGIEYRTMISENKTKVLGVENEKLSYWTISYLNKISMFETLTQGWKREINLNSSGSGPTIEEVE